MMTRFANITIKYDEKQEPYFYNELTDLETESISLPIELEGKTATFEFFKDHCEIHPADGKDRKCSVAEFLEFLQRYENEN